ncbi:hypothetical protein [Spartinivicinus ruber]|uniref:hypothetical protein n=1 Tax=Spartinivicinus ruber TaxID=2683272 RepID=UPI0013D415A9|nr:hypothetical protein [Spartinivicinus ruber]
MAINVFTETELQPLLEEATANQTKAQFISRTVKNLINTLRRNALHYRAYGPYWWWLKQLLMEQGDTRTLFSVGNLDEEILCQLSFSDPAYGIVAAWQYAEWQFEMGAQANTQHVLDTEEGDLLTYELFDEELEVRAALRQAH